MKIHVNTQYIAAAAAAAAILVCIFASLFKRMEVLRAIDMGSSKSGLFSYKYIFIM